MQPPSTAPAMLDAAAADAATHAASGEPALACRSEEEPRHAPHHHGVQPPPARAPSAAADADASVADSDLAGDDASRGSGGQGGGANEDAAAGQQLPNEQPQQHKQQMQQQEEQGQQEQQLEQQPLQQHEGQPHAAAQQEGFIASASSPDAVAVAPPCDNPLTSRQLPHTSRWAFLTPCAALRDIFT